MLVLKDKVGSFSYYTVFFISRGNEFFTAFRLTNGQQIFFISICRLLKVFFFKKNRKKRNCWSTYISLTLFGGFVFCYVPDVDECKEKLACQCPECKCKNTWGSYECSCSSGLLYMQEHDTCIGGCSSLFSFCSVDRTAIFEYCVVICI